MKAEFNIDTQELVGEITQEVVKALKPYLKGKGEDDTIFDVKGLAEYLKVEESWIYQNQRSIPHFKIGRFTRYRKIEIDKWLETLKVPATEPLYRPLKLIK